MDLAGIQNGGIIGFKYFGFGGLSKDTKGVKAFEGTKKGDNARLYLNLTSSGKGAFKIHIKLDNPWKGEEIGVIGIRDEFPAGKSSTVSCRFPPLKDSLASMPYIWWLKDLIYKRRSALNGVAGRSSRSARKDFSTSTVSASRKPTIVPFLWCQR